MMRITHRQVEIFRALMTAGSVTKAAEMLFTSQPTVSRELARLEQIVGVVFFERAYGRLRPTMPALTLFEEVKRAYSGLERVASVAAGLREFKGGPLLVISLPAFSHSLLPRACSHFREAHPDVNVSISSQESPLLDEWLTAQRFDLGLTENDVPPPGTRLTPFLEMDEVCILPSGHPLLGKPVISLQDFAGQSFISLSSVDPYRIQLDEAFSAQGINRRLLIEMPSAVSVCDMVREGLGLAVVNPLTALDFEGRGLHIKPLEVSFPFRISLVQPEYRPLNPSVSAFIHALGTTAAEIAREVSELGLWLKRFEPTRQALPMFTESLSLLE
jgi:DNA-binding transcriptional LysR family regulator